MRRREPYQSYEQSPIEPITDSTVSAIFILGGLETLQLKANLCSGRIAIAFSASVSKIMNIPIAIIEQRRDMQKMD